MAGVVTELTQGFFDVAGPDNRQKLAGFIARILTRHFRQHADGGNGEDDRKQEKVNIAQSQSPNTCFT